MRHYMDSDMNFSGIAVLIDADNAQLSKLKAILDEISKYGRIIVKKAFGDWKSPELKKWEVEIKQLAIKPEQQFANTKGKNATDIALVIDAMDLLYTKSYDAFVIVSSDADYTPLAIKLRETGAYIFGVGEDKTPAAFRNSCDSFILTKHLIDSKEKPPKKENNKSTTDDTSPDDASLEDDEPDIIDISEIHKLLKTAEKTFQDDDGWVNAATAGNYLKRARPDFDIKAYGFDKLLEMFNEYPDIYETKKDRVGKGTVVTYRIK
jgi:uncharacterized protein (TIGR00288 family)